MDHRGTSEEEASLREERDRLASQLRETEAALRAAQARIQMLEQRLACRGERAAPPGGCVRCAQIAHGLEVMQQRMRAQGEENTVLRREVTTLTARVETLEKRNAELETKRHRSAAPFRRPPEKRTGRRKRPGGQQGHAPHVREVPPEAPLERVTAPLCGCPECGGPVTEVRALKQVIVEIPPVTPRYYEVVTYSGHCKQCGRVRSTHPLQVSGATGSAGVHLGQNAQAVAVSLRHSYGLPLSKVCGILWEHFQVRLTPGGLCTVLRRTAQTLRPDWERLRHEVRTSPSVHSDETSWWLDGAGACLWVAATTLATLYHISRKRDRATLEAILGAEYLGVLVSDCLNIYDRYAAAFKSKCVSHHQRAIQKARGIVGERPFLAGMRRLLGMALRLQRRAGRLPEATYQQLVERMEQRLTKLLEPHYEHPEEERIAQRFRRCREHILTFLHRPEVAATNNLAERQLRPAVITRKLSCGNKTEAGAQTWETLASLAATCRQRGRSFMAFVASRLPIQGAAPPGLPPPRPAPGHG